MIMSSNNTDKNIIDDNDVYFEGLRNRSPLSVFAEWFAAAAQCEEQANAMTLATVDANGMPQARTVLLKTFVGGAQRFVFFTNRDSRKGRALRVNAQAALLFYWPKLSRQVLAEGDVEELPRAEVADYFSSRPRDSRIGAWASAQSQPMESAAAFRAQVAMMEAKFAGAEPPLPPYWAGFALTPRRLEFWREGAHRLHRRLVFWRDDGDAPWHNALLQP